MKSYKIDNYNIKKSTRKNNILRLNTNIILNSKIKKRHIATGDALNRDKFLTIANKFYNYKKVILLNDNKYVYYYDLVKILKEKNIDITLTINNGKQYITFNNTTIKLTFINNFKNSNKLSFKEIKKLYNLE